ncbi:MAG TPA: Gfo/Idh/MocA family oxidoreductase, partial [Clostridia bacterium]|nr:Gfo/Idh/MocA family oxidoreductase [Clostridia bacterium]
MDRKKLAIIGCGGIGRYHLNHFRQFDDIEIAGVCDIILERAEAFAAEAHCKAFTHFKDMYGAVSPDMVFICVPPTEHGEIELETIRRGIHLFVEKPVALTKEKCIMLRDAIKASGVISASGFQLRYESNIEKLKEFAKRHPIVEMNMMRLGGIPDTPWWKSRALSGGQIVEQTIHQFDMARNIMGEPDTVFTLGGRNIVKEDGFDTEDMSVTLVRFQNGALGTITTGCYAKNGACADNKLTFGAVDARADYYMFDKVAVYGETQSQEDDATAEVVKGDGRMKQLDAAIAYKPEGDCGILCDRTFIEAVQTGDASKIRSPYEDAVKSVLFT